MRTVNYLVWVSTAVLILQAASVYGFGDYIPTSPDERGGFPLILADNMGVSPVPDRGVSSANQPADKPKDAVKAPETDSRGSGKSASKPLKPFRPSEKIKADQVVDFPYDI
jgi:hypothetical protein